MARNRMRTFAPNNAFHGRRDGTKWICSCADVTVYRGSRLHYTVPLSLLIDGVVQLIQDLPDTVKYDFGFVRPVGEDYNFDKSMDVFFPVTTPAQAHDAHVGKARPLSDMLEPAHTSVSAVLAMKRYWFLYPGGADHVRFHAYS
jgi:hypothetical protein